MNSTTLVQRLPSRHLCVLFLTVAALAGLQSVAAQIPDDLELVDLGAAVDSVLAIRNAGDGSGRLFLVEREGTVEIFVEGVGVLGTPFLDIETDVDTTFEGGLTGLAFHPDFATNGYFYVYYTREGTGGDVLETVVERFSVSAGDSNDADETTRREVFTLGQPAGNHNGGDIHFGPDGYLYIGLGDGGASAATAQDNEDLLGSMLRIDPCDDPTCAVPFTVPASNPFFGDDPITELIWASGLRNPYRWSFDRKTGDMFIGDVGQSTREEVSFQAAESLGGENYGWPCREGNIAGPGGCSGSFVAPIITYATHEGPPENRTCTVVGGYRYQGCIYDLRGTYIYADYCAARIWFATETSPGSWSSSEWDDLNGRIFGFGEGEEGELDVSQGDEIFRFESETGCPIFEDDFESGGTSAWDKTVPGNS